MSEPDQPIDQDDARNLVIRSVESTPRDVHLSFEAFESRLGRFTAALEHLLTVAGFYVAGDPEGATQYLDPVLWLMPVARQAFAEADKTRWECRPPWSGALGGPPPEFVVPESALATYDRAAGEARDRWGCTPQWFLRDGEGVPWFGWLYPSDFPATHAVTRRELDMMGMALKLLRLKPSAPTTEDRPVAAPAERYVVACKADVVRFLAPTNTDTDNTKLVDRQKTNGRLDFREAKCPVGSKSFEFLFHDPEEHARFERHMGIIRP